MRKCMGETGAGLRDALAHVAERAGDEQLPEALVALVLVAPADLPGRQDERGRDTCTPPTSISLRVPAYVYVFEP